jgi:endonuclease/exonuclease/phosphatase family metal-dependent hydrolase
VSLRVLSWNLMHGRALPPAGRDLLDEFAGALAGWEWDVALLQEVPPWWPDALGAATSAEAYRVLTSRNSALWLRTALASRRPDLLGANGGGANAILVREAAGEVSRHRTHQLALLPERRWLQAVWLASGWWIGNVHLSTRAAKAQSEAVEAAHALLRWADGAPVVLGGDFNVHGLRLSEFERVAVSGVDYVFAATGLGAGGPGVVPDRGRLSDHAPVIATVVADDRG